MWCYIKNLFSDDVVIALGAVWGTLASLIFPEAAYKTAALAVLVIMLVDLLTKLIALSKQAGGLWKALKTRRISSAKFLKGTSEKFIILIIMLVVGACAYRISPIADLATWFMQVIFTLMFLRDVISIVENLTDAGIKGLEPFKKLFKKKYDEACGTENSSENNNSGGT